jgi:hypothetical protein
MNPMVKKPGEHDDEWLEAQRRCGLANEEVRMAHPEDFERSQLFHAILRTDNTAFMTLVIDDCPEKERASIWNSLR